MIDTNFMQQVEEHVENQEYFKEVDAILAQAEKDFSKREGVEIVAPTFVGETEIIHCRVPELAPVPEWKCYMEIGCGWVNASVVGGPRHKNIHIPGPNCDISCPGNENYDPDWRNNVAYNEAFWERLTKNEHTSNRDGAAARTEADADRK